MVFLKGSSWWSVSPCFYEVLNDTAHPSFSLNNRGFIATCSLPSHPACPPSSILFSQSLAQLPHTCILMDNFSFLDVYVQCFGEEKFTQVLHHDMNFLSENLQCFFFFFLTCTFRSPLIYGNSAQRGRGFPFPSFR